MIRKQSHMFLAIPMVLALAACATAEQTSAPAFASPSYMGPGGRIVGNVEVDFDGSKVGCLTGSDVFLVHATSRNLDRVKADFGRTDEGFVIRPIEANAAIASGSAEARLYPEAISVRCDYDGRFYFRNIAPGEYFLMTALVMRGLRGLPTRFGDLILNEDDQARISLMDRVTIQPSKSTRAVLEYRDS